MNRVESSFEYAQACHKVIASHGDDHKKGSLVIARIPSTRGLHPMLVSISDLAEDIADGFRGEVDNVYYWDLIKSKVDNFLALRWESTIWGVIAIYVREENEAVTSSYSVAVKRQGLDTIIEAGSDQAIEVIKSISQSLNHNQTDEWFILNLVKKLPQSIDSSTLQSTHVYEMSSTEDI